MLPLFPRYGFDQSVMTPVLLGVLISWFFTETFGWVFAGLVVPGYLASVFLLDAPGGVIDVFEAVLTYGVARLIGEHLSRTGLTTRFFGRERFFLVVLVSILVRLAVEAWILPRFVSGVWAYSVGLVVVPLAANACWKTGLIKGAVQNGVPTLLVFLLLRYAFTPYTNLSLAGFELATQNVAASFLGSPKAYILLVTGAVFAAATNVRYGWDFNGILVPALLGLAIFKPVEFGATFAETVVLYLTVLLILRVTPLGKANVEGPRRTVLFFAVDYALRFAFAALLGSHVPGEDIVSYTGFGYLLPTLMAVKISQKSSVPLIVLPTFNVSVIGFVAGTFIGYAATLFDAARDVEAPEFTRAAPAAPKDPAWAALWTSALAVEGISGSNFGLAFELARPWELFAAAARGDAEPARRAGYSVDHLDGGVILLRERFVSATTARGLPTYLFRANPARTEPIVAFVAEPRRDAACVVAAGRLVANGLADVAVIAGVSRPSDPWFETSAHAVAQALAEGGMLVSLDGDAKRAPTGVPAVPSIDARADAALPRIRAALGLDAASAQLITGAVVEGREFRVTLDLLAWAWRIAPRPERVSLESATAISIALDDVRASTIRVDLEHLVALRRLVLDPLFAAPNGAETDRARALAPYAAAMLGYSLTAPTVGPHEHEVVALIPRERGLPIAVVARTSGVATRLVEAPLAARRGVRDLALRLGAELDADAIILGEAWRGGLRYGAVREAQAAATDRVNPQIFYVRSDEAALGLKGVDVASWMDDGTATTAALTAATALGLVAEKQDLDAPQREVFARTMLRPSSLVSITAGPTAERTVTLDSARRATTRLASAGIASVDGTLMDAAKAMDQALAPTGPSSTEDFAETTRRATTEQSAVAERALARTLQAGEAKATLVRTAAGTYLVAVARREARRQRVVASVEPATEWSVEERDWADCLRGPIRVGVCTGSAP